LFLVQEFKGGADNRRDVAGAPADILKLCTNGSIGNMRAIPGEQEVNAVSSRNGDMSGINGSAAGQGRGIQESFGKSSGVVGGIKKGNTSNCLKPSRGRLGIAARNLSEDSIRNEEVKTGAAKPPVSGHLLMAS